MRILLVGVLLIAAGCDTDAVSDKTYPPAGTFPMLSVTDLFDAAPGRYNVDAFVAQVFACPPDAICELADTITIADGLETDPGPPAITLYAETVEQFEEGVRYRFSLDIRKVDGGPPYAVTLLGYDRL